METFAIVKNNDIKLKKAIILTNKKIVIRKCYK